MCDVAVFASVYAYDLFEVVVTSLVIVVKLQPIWLGQTSVLASGMSWHTHLDSITKNGNGRWQEAWRRRRQQWVAVVVGGVEPQWPELAGRGPQIPRNEVKDQDRQEM